MTEPPDPTNPSNPTNPPHPAAEPDPAAAALAAARALTREIDHFDQLATIEVAAMGGPEAAREPIRICAVTREQVDRHLAAPGSWAAPEPQPEPAFAITFSRRKRRERAEAAAAAERAGEAWEREYDDMEAAAEAALDDWRRRADPGWIAGATAARDAALDDLVTRGLWTSEVREGYRDSPLAALMMHAALAWD